MIPLLLRISLLCFVSHLTYSQSLRPRDRQETYVLSRVEKKKTKKSKNRNKYRLDVTIDSTTMSLRITQSQKFPSKLRRVQVRYQNTETRRTRSQNTTRKAMLSSIARHQNERVAAENITPKKARDIRNFINGRDGGNTMKYQWHDVFTSVQPGGQEEVAIKVKSGLFRNTMYDVDTLPKQAVFGLPELDPTACADFDRFFHRKQTQGWGIQNLHYQPFRLSNRKIIRQSFEIFFDKNSSDARPEDLQPVISYLKENDLSILQVRIEGYSSIEGD